MGLVLAFAPYQTGWNLAVDRGDFWYFWYFWYFWQRSAPTVWSRLPAWVPYTVHQLSIWFLIAQAQRIRPRYVLGLHVFNVWALGINGFFVLLHIGLARVMGARPQLQT